MKGESRTIAVNRKAHHDYDLRDSVEAGLALTGTEIKSVREGRVNLRDAYVQIKGGEAWLMEMHITPYERGGYANHDPRRPRKLLLHRDEIVRLGSQVAQKGLTLVPTRLYLKNGRAKVEVALAKGRKLYDKREAISKRESEIEIGRAIKTVRGG